MNGQIDGQALYPRRPNSKTVLIQIWITHIWIWIPPGFTGSFWAWLL